MRSQRDKGLSFFGISMSMEQPKKETTASILGWKEQEPKWLGRHTLSHCQIGYCMPPAIWQWEQRVLLTITIQEAPGMNEIVQTIKKQQNRLASHRLKEKGWGVEEGHAQCTYFSLQAAL